MDHLGFPKFQWSVFSDNTHRDQFVIRSDDLAEFLDHVEVIKNLLPTPPTPHSQNGKEPGEGTPPGEERSTTPLEQEIPRDVCAIHHKPMKQRFTKDKSSSWLDHRWTEQGPDGSEIWMRCNGTTIKAGRNVEVPA